MFLLHLLAQLPSEIVNLLIQFLYLNCTSANYFKLHDIDKFDYSIIH